jgi:hypothetical protein
MKEWISVVVGFQTPYCPFDRAIMLCGLMERLPPPLPVYESKGDAIQKASPCISLSMCSLQDNKVWVNIVKNWRKAAIRLRRTLQITRAATDALDHSCFVIQCWMYSVWRRIL